MRKLFSIFAAVLLTATVWAQSPEKISYQAVIRNSSDALVTNTQIGMVINILQGTPSGTVVYTETQTPTTNANGLISIEIGGGTGFNTIDWANGPYFIKTETDPTGGTNYTITGTSQLLSVPYALHSKTAETVTGGITETDPVFGASVASGITAADTTNWNNKLDSYTETDPVFGASVASDITAADTTNWNNKLDSYTEIDPVFGASVASGITGTDTAYWNHKQDQLIAGTNITIIGNNISATGGGSSNDFYLGQDTLGGIVFYIYIGSDGNQHGLIVSKTETTAKWQNTGVLVNANKTSNGAYNMNLMSDSPARTWVETLGAGWYLPSIDELSLLWHNRFHVNNSTANGLTLLSTTAYYWSSTENNATGAFLFYFPYGYALYDYKTSTSSIRAVRAF